MMRPHQAKFKARVTVGSILLLAACSSSSTAPVPLSALNGKWIPNTTEVPGLVYEFTLVLQGSDLTGSGQWSVGNSQSGTVSLTGVASTSGVTFDLTLGHDAPGTLPFLVEHFDGKLRSSTRLSGQVTSDAGVSQQTYSKVGQ